MQITYEIKADRFRRPDRTIIYRPSSRGSLKYEGIVKHFKDHGVPDKHGNLMLDSNMKELEKIGNAYRRFSFEQFRSVNREPIDNQAIPNVETTVSSTMWIPEQNEDQSMMPSDREIIGGIDEESNAPLDMKMSEKRIQMIGVLSEIRNSISKMIELLES
jgi:hypothetical protein